METTEITLPAYWSSALVNNDYSGLDENEAARCSKIIKAMRADGWEVVDVARNEDGEGKDSRFTRSYDLYDPESDVSGGDVLDYVIHKRR